jgi:hypothetical protein
VQGDVAAGKGFRSNGGGGKADYQANERVEVEELFRSSKVFE